MYVKKIAKEKNGKNHAQVPTYLLIMDISL